MRKLSGKDAFAIIRIALSIALCLLFAIVGMGNASKTPLCLYHSVTGRLCPGCGGTRAMLSLMHLNFPAAYSYNPVLTLFFFPAFMLLIVDDAASLAARLRGGRDRESFVEYIIYGSFLGAGKGEGKGK